MTAQAFYDDAIRNLHMVIKIVQEVPEAQFNMEHWWSKDGMAFDDERNVMYQVADGPCGCVVGHLIQRGLLEKSVIDISPGGVWSRVSDALKLYNAGIVEWLFSQYFYRSRPVRKEQVLRRLEFTVAELEIALEELKTEQALREAAKEVIA